MILDKIVEKTRQRVEELKKKEGLETLKEKCENYGKGNKSLFNSLNNGSI